MRGLQVAGEGPDYLPTGVVHGVHHELGLGQAASGDHVLVYRVVHQVARGGIGMEQLGVVVLDGLVACHGWEHGLAAT